MTILEKRKLAPERDEHLKNGEFTVLNGEYSKNFNVYVVGEKHKEAVDFIKVALDRSTDNYLALELRWASKKTLMSSYGMKKTFQKSIGYKFCFAAGNGKADETSKNHIPHL